jgi:Short C-terminal domain
MPELLAAKAANRMRTSQSYRTMARMQRRRPYMRDRMGVRQDFQPAGEPEPQQVAPTAAPPAAPRYAAELEQLAQLRDQGVITAEDFEAKKRQLLGN